MDLNKKSARLKRAEARLNAALTARDSTEPRTPERARYADVIIDATRDVMMILHNEAVEAHRGASHIIGRGVVRADNLEADAASAADQHCFLQLFSKFWKLKMCVADATYREKRIVDVLADMNAQLERFEAGVPELRRLLIDAE